MSAGTETRVAPTPVAARHDTAASVEERRALGRQARVLAPREGVGDWDEHARGHDPIGTILAQNDIRLAEVVPLRHQRIAASPWNFYRGAAAVMAADLASRPHSRLEVQLCGDAHVLNFGLWATPERNLNFDLRDFDETLPGPFEWDVARLAASVVVAARENGIKKGKSDAAVTAAVDAYRRRMRTYANLAEIDIWYDGMHLDRFTPVDIVRQVVGVGSVGMVVYLVLFMGRSGTDPLFLQCKQAGPSVYEAHTYPSVHDHHGARVIVGKRMVQSATDIFVGWGSLDGRDYYVRQYRDMKIIPTTDLIAPVLSDFAAACGSTLARAHARSGDPVAIDAYIGKGGRFTEAMRRFAQRYADQTERDHERFVSAIRRGRVEVPLD